MLASMVRKSFCDVSATSDDSPRRASSRIRRLRVPKDTISSVIDMSKNLRRILIWSVVIAGVGAPGCSGSTGPQHLPTLLVTNGMCAAGHCGTLEVRAFVWKFTIPQHVWGAELVAYVPPGATCLTFPASWTWTIIGPDTLGHVDTTTITWTPGDPAPIFLIALDSTYFHTVLDSAQADSVSSAIRPFDGIAPGSVGETMNFVPGNSLGWSITFPSPPGAPNLNAGGAPIAEGKACTP